MKAAPNKTMKPYCRAPIKGLFQVLDYASDQQWPDLLLAFLVLCRFQQGKIPCTTGGANSISKYLGVSRKRATQLFETLQKIASGPLPQDHVLLQPEVWRSMVSDVDGKSIPDKKGKFPFIVIVPDPHGSYLYFPAIFFDGTGRGTSHPPIQRLRSIYPKPTCLDAIKLLMLLYLHYDLEMHGGCDPRTFCYSWVKKGEWGKKGEGAFGYYGKKQDGRMTWHFFLVGQQGRTLHINQEFLVTVTQGDQDRFLEAFRHLREQNLVYEVGYVFEDNPMEKAGGEPLYPIWVFDQYLRDRAKELDSGLGGLYSDCMNITTRSGLMDEFYHDWKQSIFEPYELAGCASNMFAIAAPTIQACVLSVIRPRYYASTSANTQGYLQDVNRAHYWKNQLKTAFTNEYAF